MLQRCDHRAGHYVLLFLVAAGLFLPNLGGPSLWDIDEGHNTEAAREMMVSGDWVVPTFNFRLRVDKPALLYWLQIGAFRLFGVNEFAARFPSAVAALLTVLLAYELGRSLFGPRTGLLSGLVLASALMFSASAHFANPDALLDLFTVLTFFLFWHGLARTGRVWFVPLGVSTALAVLAKGPVGLVLPAAVVGLFLLWSRRLHLLFRWRLLPGLLAFGLVALPWYVWVGVDTKTDFLTGFFLTHNVGRYLHPMERHGGPIYYYFFVLALGFAPWSAFLGLTGWYAARDLRGKGTEGAGSPDPAPAVRFLACWVGVYFVFFSLAGTKLPNYILPVYAPVAILTARFLERWRRGEIQPAPWVVHAGLAGVALVGAGTAAGLLVAGGTVGTGALHVHPLPGLERWSPVGLLPLLGAAAGWWCLARRNRSGMVAGLTAASVLFTGLLAGWGGSALEDYKAPRALVGRFWSEQEGRDVRVGCYGYYQPSLVFYCRREVSRFEEERDTLEFLNYPVPVYLFLPAAAWQDLQTRVTAPCHVLARARDFYRGQEVVVVTNR